MRPAPDPMRRLSALLPVAQGVAAYAALARHADSSTASADDRGRGQIMADTLLAGTTNSGTINSGTTNSGATRSDEGDTAVDEAADEPALLVGYGPIPAGLARDLALGRDDDSDSAPPWLRRLFRAPRTGQLAAMESTRRLFTDAQRRFIRLRDQTCRTPWCDAPIRHTDHIQPAATGGRTTVHNGQGLCAACNYARQAPGWHAWNPDHARTPIITTPTGHRHVSDPPELPGRPPPPRSQPPESPLERHARDILHAA